MILFVELARPAWVDGFDWVIPIPTCNRSFCGRAGAGAGAEAGAEYALPGDYCSDVDAT